MFRINRLAAPAKNLATVRVASMSNSTNSNTKTARRAAAVVAASTVAVAGGVALVSDSLMFASSDVLHAPHYPWSHKGRLASFDHAAIRRGFQGTLTPKLTKTLATNLYIQFINRFVPHATLLKELLTETLLE